MSEQQPNLQSILDMARGAFKEAVDLEIQKILDNILDPNCKASAKRTVTVQLELVPSEARDAVTIDVGVQSKLVPIAKQRTQLYMVPDGDGVPRWVEATPQIPGQRSLFGGEQEDLAILRFPREASV